MKKSSNSVRIGIAVAVILGTIGWLAFTSYGANKSYYVTVAELGKMGDKAYTSNLRVEGFVVPGSIEQEGPHVTFVLNEFESHNANAPKGRKLTVVYKGQEPPPDTFKDDAQALAMGTIGRDGVFHATALQAKCASKYAPAEPGAKPGAPGKPGMTPPQKQATPASNSQASGAPAEVGKETAGIASN
ncbi:MAG TPA: cytochrome c maturation protein CcmE [Terracidiphilus sp.]|nr:cytochrome c maturation protein CcmE [Terracidiphilus sp.]